MQSVGAIGVRLWLLQLRVRMNDSSEFVVMAFKIRRWCVVSLSDPHKNKHSEILMLSQMVWCVWFWIWHGIFLWIMERKMPLHLYDMYYRWALGFDEYRHTNKIRGWAFELLLLLLFHPLSLRWLNNVMGRNFDGRLSIDKFECVWFVFLFIVIMFLKENFVVFKLKNRVSFHDVVTLSVKRIM